MLSSVDSLEQRAREIILRLLERGPKTSDQLRQALLKAEVPSEIAEALITRFAEVELIDDRQYAQQLSDASRRTKGMARSAVRRKLAQKGLDQAIIDQVTTEISDEAELEAAIEAACKRFGQLQSYPPEVRNRRLVGFMQRRGFSSAVVFAAIREAEARAVKSEL
jgi:regulatory protein